MSNWQCVVCGARLEHSKNLEFKTSVSGREIIITNLSGAKCLECDEKYFDADASDQIDEVLSKYTQPVIKFKRKIIEHDDRKVIDIPLELEEALHIKVGEEVEISMEGDRIISQIIQRKSAKRASA